METHIHQLTDNALLVLTQRYLKKDADGHVLETPDELFRRVAKAIAEPERSYHSGGIATYEEEFYQALSSLDFLPNSPTLMNAGTKLSQLSACFVLPVKDNMNAIFSTLKTAALIQQSGGGTGFNFSALRPEKDYVSGTGGEASGPVSFMQIFDAATQHIKQGGKRRGANMGILNADHPDIEQFITAKKNPAILSNFNISVNITDDFMAAVEANGSWKLRHPKTGKAVAQIKARDLWDKIVLSAWETGDPGLIFGDEINRRNPLPGLGPINATNPCGEVPLLPYEACNLGSINLKHMVRLEGDQYVIDWKKLAATTGTAVRFLDNTIDANKYTNAPIRKMALGNRKIGLGVMGWAEMLILLEIPYDSEAAVKLGEQVMQFINRESFLASQKLAEERGVFPNWGKSVYHPKTPLRNATRTSIAPTGTISILANTSPSIEPLFALAFERTNVLDGKNLPEINSLFAHRLNSLSPDLLQRLRREGEAKLLRELPPALSRIFPTAMRISWEYHIKHQVAFQKHTDNAVSKTINLPASATVEQVSHAYQMAWKNKAKGITVYRYDSKQSQVMNRKEDAAVLLQDTSSCKICLA